MVKKILKVLHAECGGLHQAAAVLALSSVVSSLLALFRDRLLAGTFSAGQELDIYFAAFKIPDFIYIISMFLSSNTVLIPFFLEKVNSSREKAKEFLDNIFNLFFIFVLAMSGVAFLIMPYLVKFVAPGFSPEALVKTALIARIMLLSPIFIGLSNLISVVTQSFNRFFLYALCPIVYNIGIIIGIVFFAPKWGVAGIAIGVAIGALLHFAIQIPVVASVGFLPVLKSGIDFKEIWRIIRSSSVRTFGLALNQIVIVCITAAASLLAAGSIAIFNFSFNLQSVPLSVIGLSYSVAAFPVLSNFFVNNRREEFMNHLIIASRQIIFWSIPLSAGIVVLRAQIVRVLLGYGKFDWGNTRLTAAALAIFSVSIAAQSLVFLFVRAFYAAGKTAKPVIINAVFSVFIIAMIFLMIKIPVLNFAAAGRFAKIMRVADVAGTEALVLPLAYSIGMILNAVFLIWFFRNEFGHVWSRIGRAFGQSLFASLAMGMTIYSALNYFDALFGVNNFLRTFGGIFLQGAVSGILGIIVWFAILYFMKSAELLETLNSLRQKFWKTEVVAPEPRNVEGA